MPSGLRVLLALLWLSGCAHVAPSEQSVANPPLQATKGAVFLFNGMTLFSEGNAGTGTYNLAQAIRRRGVRAEIDRPSGWLSAADGVIQDTALRDAPIAVYGYSYGAQAGLQFAERLGSAGIPVQTVFLVEAFRPVPVACNVRFSRHVQVAAGLLVQSSPTEPALPGCNTVINIPVSMLMAEPSEHDHWSVSRLDEVHRAALLDLLEGEGVRTRPPVAGP